MTGLAGNATAGSVTLFLDSRRTFSAQDLTAYWDDVVSYRAYVPPAPAVGSPTDNSLTVDVVPGCNVDNTATEYAISIGSGAFTLGTHWVQANGTVGTTAVWQTDANWATKTVTGLSGGLAYTFEVQARYSTARPQPTSLGAGAAGTTTGTSPLIITQSPSAQNICPNETALFSVTVSGSGTITYQWQKNSANLTDGGHYSGATTASLTVSTADANDVANYRCVISNGSGSTNSSQAALTLKALTSITGQPSAQNVCPGVNATFTITASGEGTLTYQWQTNGVNIGNSSHYGGCTTATLTVSNVAGADAVNYRCVVAGGCGNATSSPAALTLLTATTITQQPAAQTVWPGSNVTFSVTADGEGAMTYQWQKNGTNLSDGGHYSATTTSTLAISGADTNDAASYACVVSGGCGSVTSASVTLDLWTGGAITTAYAINRAIPDGSFIGISDTRTVAAPFPGVADVKVRLKISGTYNGDLFCYVTHGSGYSVLLNRVGRTASNPFGYDDPGLDVTFDGAAGNDVHVYRLAVTGNHNTGLGTNVMGTWVADGRTNRPTTVLDTDGRPALLNAFTNLDPNGSWTIFVADVAGGDAHTLESWGLEIGGPEAVPATGTIYGKVQLQGFTGTGPRTVRFVALDGGGAGVQTNDVSLSFAGSPKLADYTLSVPTNTAYVSAKSAWNLRRRQAVAFSSGVATNNFTGSTGQLLGGDISQNNNLVNTADYTVLKGNWLKTTAGADLTGDANVNTADYTILKGNWLKTGDPQ